MKAIQFIVLAFSVLMTMAVNAQAFRSEAYCQQLADIGRNTFNVKQSGGSLSSIQQRVRYILAGDPQKLQAAEGVIVAIYRDGSIKNSSHAYDIVYSSCRR